ncbi:MAG: 3-hydroxyacyl-ACP dehydratase [Bacteroidia bacterium]
MKPIATKETIEEYIPQRPPVVMIDSLISCDEVKTVTEFTVSDEKIFVSGGFLQEPGIMENMAQTAAAKAGYEVKQKGIKPLIGFIGAIKGLKIFYLPKTGDIVRTTSVIKTEVMGITLIEASSEANGAKIAECEMKIVLLKPDEARP